MTEQATPKLQVRLPLILAIVMAAGMFIGQQLPRYDQNFRLAPGKQGQTEVGSALDEILRYIQAKYVDTVDINALKEGAIGQLLNQLDPHSVYMSPDELQHEEEVMNGNFEGIGIEFLLVDDTIQVITPLSGGPSEAAGILTGDKIITITDSVVAGVNISNANIFKKLRGEKGTPVKVGVLRGREAKLLTFTLVRDVIPVHSVDVAYMLDESTGYIKINRFSAPTHQEFMDALRPLVEKKGLKNLVLDLRGNPGGYLNEATKLLSQFFSEGKLLVYTQGRTEKRQDYLSSGRTHFDIREVAVLIDEGSASASEIVAGAIQDHDRGWVIGRRSFGKGLVQVQYPLSDGGALRLTISRYYTPSGRSIQREYKNDEDYDHEADRRLKNGELADASKIIQADSTQFYTGMGRVVYAGGGITPDVFIPLDTSFLNENFYAARQRLPHFASRWLEAQDRNRLPKTLDEFNAKFQVSEQMFSDFLIFLQKEGVEAGTNLLLQSKHELRVQLKARIAKLLFQEEGLYRVINDDDPVVQKAIQVLKMGKPVAQKAG